MGMTKKGTANPYDLWKNADLKAKKLHPSAKRNKKNPLPHPGQSYNPHPEDHRKLLQKIAEKELEYQKKLTTTNKAVFVKVDPKELRKDAKEELFAGIKHLIKSKESTGDKRKNTVDYDSDSSQTEVAYSDYDEKDFEAIIKDKRVVEKRKSKQQRLKQMKDYLQRKAAKLRKMKNIRSAKFDGLKKMVKDLDKKDKELATKRKTKRHRQIKNERLGQKFEQSDPIYCLREELPSSLRQLSCPLKSVVREQLESFQSRLMVEPSQPQVKSRKYKRHQFERKAAGEQEG